MKQSKYKSQGQTINQIMAFKSNDDLRSYLEQRPDLNLSIMKQKNQSTLLHFAAFKNQLVKMKIYILHFEAFVKENSRRNRNEGNFQNQLKAWINNQNSDGLSALHFAALHGNIQMIQFLERYGANMQTISKDKQNILFMASENNHLKLTIYLLQFRQGKIPFKINETNHLGQNILHKVSKHGFSNFVSYLINHQQMDINARTNQGMTALMLAVSGGHKQIVKRMLLKGVNRYLTNNEQKTALNIAKDLNRFDMVKILKEDYTNCQKIQIACNLRIVYKVEKSSVLFCIYFLILFHLIFLPTNTLVEIDFLDNTHFYAYYIILGFYYLLTMATFILLTRKHPVKAPKKLLELEFPFCPQCKNTIKSQQFHCFICNRCIYRYDHHCPWINNCVSTYNIGKFISFIILLIIGSIEVMFVSLSFYLKAFDCIKLNRLINIPQEEQDKYILTNAVVSGLLSAIFCILLFYVLGEQLKNLCSNTTSFQRARNLKKTTSSILTSNSIDRNSINEALIEQEQQTIQNKGCITNCCAMLKENYLYE